MVLHDWSREVGCKDSGEGREFRAVEEDVVRGKRRPFANYEETILFLVGETIPDILGAVSELVKEARCCTLIEFELAG